MRFSQNLWYLSISIVSADVPVLLTHRGRVTHICIGNLAIIGSDNGLSPGRRQAITWTNVGILLIGPLGTNFSEIIIEINTFSFKKIHLKMSSGKWRPVCLGLNVLKTSGHQHPQIPTQSLLSKYWVHSISIDQIHKFHNAQCIVEFVNLVYTNRMNPNMSHIPQCTIQNRNVHISVLNGVLWDI